MKNGAPKFGVTDKDDEIIKIGISIQSKTAKNIDSLLRILHQKGIKISRSVLIEILLNYGFMYLEQRKGDMIGLIDQSRKNIKRNSKKGRRKKV